MNANANAYYQNPNEMRNQQPNANMHYAPQPNANMYYAKPENEMNQELGYNYNAADQNNQAEYPQTGLSPGDAFKEQPRSEFVLPENVKLGMMLCAACCCLMFFVVMLVK